MVRFGVFEAELCSGELRKNGIKVKVQDLPFRALKLFLARPNEVLSRDQFRQALWPDGVFVDFDHGISSAINRLRDALGDSAANPVFIETVGRRGYRWIAPVHVPERQIAAAPVVSKINVPPPIAQPAGIPAAQRSAIPLWQRAWVLVFPALVLLVAAWGFKPVYRAAKANVRPRIVQHQPAPTTSEAEEF